MIDLKKMRSRAIQAGQDGSGIDGFAVLELLDQLEAAQKDAARYQWLFGARTEAEVDSYSGTIGNPLPQDFVLSEIQCFYATKAIVDAAIDAAMSSQA